MELKRNGSQPSQKGPDEYFTGSVRIDSPFQATEPGRAGGAIVIFEPGADRMAFPSTGADTDRRFRLRLGAERGLTESRNSTRRHSLVPAKRAELARRNANHLRDTRRHRRSARRQGR